MRASTNNAADLQELPAPKDSANIPGSVPVKSALKAKTKDGGTQDSAPGKSLLDGQFDEGESHQGFLEALNAWRGTGKKTETGAADKAKGVRFEGDEAKKPAGKNFFANIDTNNKNFNMDNIPTFTQEGTEPDKTLSDPKFGPKTSCWQCYKLYPTT